MKEHKTPKTPSQRINLDHIRSVSIRIGLLTVFLAVAVTFISFARGYRFDFQKKSVSSTGILAVSSQPKAAKVYINGEFKGATDLNINMPPGKYTIEIKKEGYIPYTKSLTLKGEIVEAIDPILFPINPSLTPVTNLGITRAIQVEQTDRMMLVSQTGDTEHDGLYLYESSTRPLTFLPPLKTLLLKKDLPAGMDLSKLVVHFSYDYKQAILDLAGADNTSHSYLVSLDSENKDLFDVSGYKQTLIDAWEKEKQANTLKILETYPKEIRKIASDSFGLMRYSDDQTKVLYRAKKSTTLPLVFDPPLIASNQTPEDRSLVADHMYIYDMREDKNYHIADPSVDPDTIHWYSDSKRLIYKENGHISVSLYDGASRQIVYSGPIDQDFVAVTTDGKILILANLNPASNKLPDLYQVGIR